MIARAFLILIGLATLSGAGAWAQNGDASRFTVDDRALKERFQQELETFLDVEGIPQGRRLLGSSAGSGRVNLTNSKRSPEKAPLTSPELYRRATRGTVVIGHLYKCGKCARWHASLAGGVVIDSSGIVVTAHHVMESDRAEVFGAMTSDGAVFPVVKVLAASEPDDLAIVQLKTDNRQLDAMSVAATDAPTGSGLKVVSHPAGQFFTCSEGIVARYYFDPNAKALRMQITADYARGSSGCGVFNPGGELIGIVSSTRSIYYNQDHEQQKNLQMVTKSCIPVASLRKLLQADKK